jgi:hypothetical protein
VNPFCQHGLEKSAAETRGAFLDLDWSIVIIMPIIAVRRWLELRHKYIGLFQACMSQPDSEAEGIFRLQPEMLAQIIEKMSVFLVQVQHEGLS